MSTDLDIEHYTKFLVRKDFCKSCSPPPALLKESLTSKLGQIALSSLQQILQFCKDGESTVSPSMGIFFPMSLIKISFTTTCNHCLLFFCCASLRKSGPVFSVSSLYVGILTVRSPLSLLSQFVQSFHTLCVLQPPTI